jgi:hypothetical protein
MSKRHAVARSTLVILLLVAIFGAFWLGLVPQRLSPFSPIALDQPANWFIDPRLAALRHDPALCRAVLKSPYIIARPIPDSPVRNGCGWTNGVAVQSAAGAGIGLNPVTCEAAVAFALWVNYDVQPLAKSILGSRVTRLQDMGTYSCRNIIGNRLWKDFRSQHAAANAIDIGGFTLEDGRHISVRKDWRGSGPASRFLHEVHNRACRYFRVTLGPDFNAAHRDHFHLDRGFLSSCK